MSAIIYRHAKQFYGLAEAAHELAGISEFPHALVCNYCLFLELAFKALSPKADSEPVFISAPIPNAYPASSLWGHELKMLFEDLCSEVQIKIKENYPTDCDFEDDLSEISSYFTKARYAFEAGSVSSYSISSVIRLARHVCKCIEANGSYFDGILFQLKRSST